MISVLVGVGTLMGEDGGDGITALLRLTDGLGGLVKMEKRSSKLEVEKDSSGFIWLSPSSCPFVPCTSPTCPRVGALEHFLEMRMQVEEAGRCCTGVHRDSLRPKEVSVGSEISPCTTPTRWR